MRGEALAQRIGSSMVEQRPFKALVEGSSPSLSTILKQPNVSVALLSIRAGCLTEESSSLWGEGFFLQPSRILALNVLFSEIFVDLLNHL